jgi:hypothetical protein
MEVNAQRQVPLWNVLSRQRAAGLRRPSDVLGHCARTIVTKSAYYKVLGHCR